MIAFCSLNSLLLLFYRSLIVQEVQGKMSKSVTHFKALLNVNSALLCISLDICSHIMDVISLLRVCFFADTAAVLQAQMNKIATIYVVATKNNTICTLVDMKGQPIAVASAGSVGFKNSRKSTPYAAQATGERIVEKAMEKGYFQARIVMKGLGITKQSAVRALAKSRIKILEVHEHTSVPHNGCRQPRRRRIWVHIQHESIAFKFQYPVHRRVRVSSLTICLHVQKLFYVGWFAQF